MRKARFGGVDNWLMVIQTESHHMWVLLLVDDMHVVELNVQILINGMQCPCDGEVVLQFHSDLLANQSLEVGIKEHRL